jgi:hypothetical protein
MINLNPPVAAVYQRHEGRDFSCFPLDDDLRGSWAVSASHLKQACDDLIIAGFKFRPDPVVDARHGFTAQRETRTYSEQNSRWLQG